MLLWAKKYLFAKFTTYSGILIAKHALAFNFITRFKKSLQIWKIIIITSISNYISVNWLNILISQFIFSLYIITYLFMAKFILFSAVMIAIFHQFTKAIQFAWLLANYALRFLFHFLFILWIKILFLYLLIIILFLIQLIYFYDMYLTVININQDVEFLYIY